MDTLFVSELEETMFLAVVMVVILLVAKMSFLTCNAENTK